MTIHNPSTIPRTIHRGQCIAQMLYKKVLIPSIITKKSYDVVANRIRTKTMISTPTPIQQLIPTPQIPASLLLPDIPIQSNEMADIIPFNDDEIDNSSLSDDMSAHMYRMQTENDLLYQIYIFADPFDDTI